MMRLMLVIGVLLMPLPAHSFGIDIGGFGLGSGSDRASKRFRQANDLLKVAFALIPISDEEEIILGKKVAAQVITRYGIEDDAETTYYLNLIVTAIAQRSDRPDIPYHVAILSTDDVNAYACPG
ncbi:MAG: hypothetical protein R8K54_02435, partial [Mariprofundaceae bacterium]